MPGSQQLAWCGALNLNPVRQACSHDEEKHREVPELYPYSRSVGTVPA
jgi:hypothetical protein